MMEFFQQTKLQREKADLETLKPVENLLDRLERLRKEKQEKEARQQAKKEKLNNPYGNNSNKDNGIEEEPASPSTVQEEYHLFRNIFSLESELFFLQSLKIKLTDILYNSFPTSIEEDEVLLEFFHHLQQEERRLTDESAGDEDDMHDREVEEYYEKERNFLLEYCIPEMKEKALSSFQAASIANDEFNYDTGNNSTEEQKQQERKDNDEFLQRKRRKEEQLAKLFNHLLTSPGATADFITHAYSSLVYRLTRKRLLKRIISLLSILMNYIEQLIRKKAVKTHKQQQKKKKEQENRFTSFFDEKVDLKEGNDNHKNDADNGNTENNEMQRQKDEEEDERSYSSCGSEPALDPIIDICYEELLLSLKDCHRPDLEQYMTRLKVYLLSLYEKVLEN
jgi:hypothetical protein